MKNRPLQKNKKNLPNQRKRPPNFQENKVLKSTLRQKDWELDFYIKTAKTLTASLEFNRVLRVMLSASRRLVRCEDWSLLLLNESSKILHHILAKGNTFSQLKKVAIKFGEGPAGQAAQRGKPVIIPNLAMQNVIDADKFYPHIQAQSVLCFPITCKKQVLGVIQLVNALDKRGFTEYDLSLLERLVDLSGPAIERSDIYRKMSDLVTTDDLTHLYNLRYLDRVLEVEMKRSRRYKSLLSLIFIDLDFFKQVNDTHGHLMGSQVLVEMAGILIDSLRAVDVIVRYGGDEFVVLLPNTNVKRATQVAERVRTAIREHKFLEKEGLSLQITASFGIASYPEHAGGRTELIHLADRAMYESKTKGRDMVSVSS